MWIILETTWVTQRWANRVFVMGICEVNTYLAMKALDHWDESFLSFRKKLAKSLINNPYYVRKMREIRRSRSGEQEDLGREHCTAATGVCEALDRRVVGHFQQHQVSSAPL